MATTEKVINEPVFEIIVPEKKFIDKTIDENGNMLPISEFDKIIEETETIEGIITTTRMIIPMTEEEIIEKRIKDLKIKVALGTATSEEKSDLKLLIG